MADLWKFRIRELSVRGFKSIAEKQSIKIRPLTILAGANNSGKSAMIQPLLLLKQTLESPFDPGPLYLSGPNVQFTSADQFLSRTKGRTEERKLEIKVGFGSDAWLALTFRKAPTTPIDILEQAWKDDEPTRVLRTDQHGVVRDRFFLRCEVDGPQDDLRTKLYARHATRVPISFLSGAIQQVLHVPGIRANPERTYQVTGTGPNFPGTFQHYVASVIANWQMAKDPNYESLNADLQHIGLTQGVFARRLTESEIDLLVSRVESENDLVSVADVGLGISHILPALVALRVAGKGQLVYIEQPEIHLHPRAQVKLAEVLADAARRGVLVVAETHSTLLLTSIQTLVARGALKRELVKLHWFQRDARTGVTDVTSTGLDENGAFTRRAWPEDFDDVILKAEGAYLDAVEGRHARSG